MTLLVRGVAALTLLLGLAVMAVSVYAAKTQAQEPLPPTTYGQVAGTKQSSPEQTDAGTATALPDAGNANPVAARTPASTLRFWVPDRAAPAMRLDPRTNLSPGVRVWSVPSVRAGPAGTGGVGVGEIPADQLVFMQQIGNATDIPWQVLAAIGKVESDFGRDTRTSSAGAIGYGQFLPDEWLIFGAGGDPYDFRDALLAMARYLLAAGAPADVPDAIYSYNHSWEYVELVLSYATTYGYQAPTTSGSLIWPVLGPISSYFGPDHPLGIDIDQAGLVGAPVWAAQDATVLFAGGDACCSYGRYVILEGTPGIATLYAHLDTIAVRSGENIRQGETLGTVGCTGHCTGPHLHFEVIDNGVRRDPLDYLPGGAELRTSR
jgi:murein DD-endopeptidase MepM/ murein hydrolase activator NlpD